MQSLDKAYSEIGQQYGDDAARVLVAAEAIGRDIRDLRQSLTPVVDLTPELVANLEPIAHTIRCLRISIDDLTKAVNNAAPKPTLLGRLFFKKGR